MKGEYKVRHPGLKPLHAQAKTLVTRLPRVTFRAVRRHENERADELVNETLDDILGSESPR